jgi:energy-coupling factor transport system permease protein
MGGLYTLASGRGRAGLSLIGISVVGALAHNIAQIGVVYLVFIHHPGVFLLLPWLGIAAVVMGWITGVVASQVCLRLQAGPVAAGFPLRDLMPAHPAVESASSPMGSWPEIKLVFVFLLSLVIVLLQNFTAYFCIFGLLLGMIVWARLPLAAMFLGLRRVWAFLLLAFLIPAFFGKSGEPLFSFGLLAVTREGLQAGGLYAARLILFILCTTWLTKTSSPAELTAGLKNLLKPLKRLGLSLDRVADIVGLAYLLTPVFLEKAHGYIRSHNLGKPSTWKQLVPNLAAMIASLYHQAAEEAQAI